MKPPRDERFEGLFRENYASVRAYALRRASRDAAQDVVAETFLVAWRRLDDVPRDALPWLYAVARRVLANQRRSAHRSAALERRLALAEAAALQPDPSESAGEAERVRFALGRLSERSREGPRARRLARALGRPRRPGRRLLACGLRRAAAPGTRPARGRARRSRATGPS
jgi:DNA-directed RNA polymerase specialized sigma24 family protein